MVWGPMIAWYLFLAGASAGAFLTSAFVEVKYPESVKMRVAGRIIAPIFLGIGLVMLMLDAEAGLHNPLRFFWLIANPGSVMTLGVYFICVFMPVALVSALLEVLKKPVPKWLTWIGIVFAFAVAAYTGFLLGVVKAYPLWNNAILPILFVVSALSAGLAATSLVGLIVDRERFEQMWLIKKSHVILSAVEMVVLATMLIIVSAGSFEAPRRSTRSWPGSRSGVLGRHRPSGSCRAVPYRGLPGVHRQARGNVDDLDGGQRHRRGRRAGGRLHAAPAGDFGRPARAVPLAHPCAPPTPGGALAAGFPSLSLPAAFPLSWALRTPPPRSARLYSDESRWHLWKNPTFRIGAWSSILRSASGAIRAPWRARPRTARLRASRTTWCWNRRRARIPTCVSRRSPVPACSARTPPACRYAR